MATAKKVPVGDYQIHLTLTQEEANVIHALTGRMSGGGPVREASDRIYNAVDEFCDPRNNEYLLVAGSVSPRN